MNIFKKTLALILVGTFILLALPQPVLAAPPGKVILGGSYTLETGEVLSDDLVILGGMAELKEGSVVEGDVILLGGELSVAGIIEGDLTAAGGIVSLQATAIVEGDFSSMGAQVERDQDADIQGEIYTDQDIPFSIVPGTWRSTMVMPTGIHPLFDLGWFVLRAILWGLLAMLVVMFVPAQTGRVTRAATSQPLVAGGLGIATGLILPILLVVLAFTICLIPVSLLGFLLLGVAWVYGMIALGLELGMRFGRIFSKEWQPALAACVGTLLLVIILNGLSAVLPCLGWIPKILVGALGLGGVLLTRFGTQDYPNEPVIETPPAE